MNYLHELEDRFLHFRYCVSYYKLPIALCQDTCYSLLRKSNHESKLPNLEADEIFTGTGTLTTSYRSTAQDMADNRAERQGRGHSPLRQRGEKQHRNTGGHENGPARTTRGGVLQKLLSLPKEKY